MYYETLLDELFLYKQYLPQKQKELYIFFHTFTEFVVKIVNLNLVRRFEAAATDIDSFGNGQGNIIGKFTR